MQSTTWYEKRGRKYVPVAEYQRIDGWPQGFHIMYCKPGSKLVRIGINPDRVNLLAAVLENEDRMREVIRDCLEMRPRKRELTKKQVAAWKAFEAAMGNDRFMVEYESIAGIVDRIYNELLNMKGE